MKVITNNVFFTWAVTLFNLLTFTMLTVSMVFLIKFDKVNVKLLRLAPAIIEADMEWLSEDHQNKHEQAVYYEALKVPFEDLAKSVHNAKETFQITIWIAVFLFFSKLLFFSTWNYRSLRNLQVTSPWMKKSTKPFWAFLSWLIPGYQLIKPYSIFSEIYSEYVFILADKKLLHYEKDTDSGFILGIWWGLFLLSALLMPLILNSVFFREGPIHYKFSHLGVVFFAVVLWAIYLLLETILMKRVAKMDQILFENRRQFDQ